MNEANSHAFTHRRSRPICGRVGTRAARCSRDPSACASRATLCSAALARRAAASPAARAARYRPPVPRSWLFPGCKVSTGPTQKQKNVGSQKGNLEVTQRGRVHNMSLPLEMQTTRHLGSTYSSSGGTPTH